VTRTTTLAAAATLAMLALAGPAQASPANALQPANVYFGDIPSGSHPTRIVTVRNPTGRTQWIHRFDLAGAGGRKFTLSFHDVSCRVGTRLPVGASCTIRVRVATTHPEYWQTVISVYYGSHYLTRHARGQFNGSAYVHIIGPQAQPA
jgi:hypothetical protein